MAWKTRIIRPDDPTPPKRRLDMVCPGLTRFFGMIGFTTLDLGTIYLGSRWLGIPADSWSTGDLSGSAIALLAASLVLGFIGMVIGWGIAVCIPVRHERTDYTISVLWHCLANGSLIWLFLVTLVLADVVGQENAETFLKHFGEWRFGYWLIGISAAGSLMIAVLWFVAGQLRQNEKRRVFRCWLLGTPVAMGMGYLQFMVLGVETDWWVLTGALFPLALVAVSGWTIQRDRFQRLRFREKRTEK